MNMGSWRMRLRTLFIDMTYQSFSEEEFNGYRQWFYPVKESEKNKSVFDKAWQHHYTNNPHHWEYWTNNSLEGVPAYEIPIQYVVEMLCDWAAMSLVFGDKPSEFYNNKKETMVIHKDTKRFIDKLLPYFDKIVNALKESTK